MGAPVHEEPFTVAFTKKEEIARGLRGVIRCVTDSNGKQFAAKTIRKTQKGQNIVDEINVEIDVLNLCQDVETVVNLHAVHLTNRDYTLILDYYPRDLHSEVEKNEPMKEKEVVQIIKDLLKTVKFLHDRNVIHLDLKPENILINEAKTIRLCDFGMSKFLKEKDICRVAGTTEYCAPEQIQFEPLSTAADMWSIGVIAFVLLSKTSPFDCDEKHATQSAVIKCEYDFEDPIWMQRSPESKAFIQSLLKRNPKKRVSAGEALDHPWMLFGYQKPHRRLSKRSSSAALIGVSDINLNVSDTSTGTNRSDMQSPELLAIGELPPKKIKSDSK